MAKEVIQSKVGVITSVENTGLGSSFVSIEPIVSDYLRGGTFLVAMDIKPEDFVGRLAEFTKVIRGRFSKTVIQSLEAVGNEPILVEMSANTWTMMISHAIRYRRENEARS